MTNFNRTFGNFALREQESFMVLNRWYDKDENGEIDYSTYINPEKFNYTWADTSLTAQNFWVQLGFHCKVRRVASAAMIPNL